MDIQTSVTGRRAVAHKATDMTEKRRRVFIVEDEKTIADSLAAIFSTNGYDVRVAYTPENALERIAVWPPDLAILNVVLPIMNGIDFAILLKEQFPECKLLLISGNPSASDLLAEADQKGYAFELLAKPINPSDLLQTVRDLWNPVYTERTSNGSLS
jgi:CheY-like chemotaxis protein